jgi:hypothetical protein
MAAARMRMEITIAAAFMPPIRRTGQAAECDVPRQRGPPTLSDVDSLISVEADLTPALEPIRDEMARIPAPRATLR